MKKLCSAIILSILSIVIFPAVVYAGDPPNTDVDVAVTSGGDVDVGVTVTGGGNSNVTVDGISIKGALTNVIAVQDFYTLYNKEMKPTLQTVEDSRKMIEILIAASAKLIADQQNASASDVKNAKSTQEALVAVRNNLDITEEQIIALDKVLVALSARLDAYEKQIDVLSTEVANIPAPAPAVAPGVVEHLRAQYLLYFWILGGCVVLLLGLSIWALLKKQKLPR